MKAIIEKLRADFAVASKYRQQAGDWTEADTAEISAAIRTAIESQQADLVLCWARWIADIAALALAADMLSKKTEARIWAEIANTRKTQAKAA